MDNIQEIIRSVSERTGHFIAKDDPLIGFYVLLEKYAESLQNDEIALFQEKLSDLEVEMKKYEDDAKKRAEHIITIALENAQRLSYKQYADEREKFKEDIAEVLAKGIQQLQNEQCKIQHIAQWNILGCFLLFMTACVYVLFFVK